MTKSMNRMVISGLIITIIWGLFGCANSGGSLPASTAYSRILPEVANDFTAGLGVNIHFTGAPAKDLEAIQNAGFKFIRMDFAWAAIEREKGKYDFSAYDQLTEALNKRGIRALYILDYNNALYEPAQSVRSAEGRKAFAVFAAAAVKHFQGQGILWELWNEPNIGFWAPRPNVLEYMELAKAVFPAIRAADPQAICVAPATAGIDYNFLKTCFDQGLLEMVDALTVHSYRRRPPETVIKDIEVLRAILAYYGQPNFPILSGEWGYSDIFEGLNPERQGQYLARMFLTNISLGIPLSIWYDLKDDGAAPKDPEHHFGTLTIDYAPKPAYRAMQNLAQALKGMHFVKRMESESNDYLMLFADKTAVSPANRDKSRQTIAGWTTGAGHEITVSGQKIKLSESPQYFAKGEVYQ